MYNAASELYNDLLQTYFDEYYDLFGAKRSKMYPKHDPANLTLDENDKKLDENLNSKQTIHQAHNIISTNKSWKEFKQTEKKSDKYYISCISMIKSPKNFTTI